MHRDQGPENESACTQYQPGCLICVRQSSASSLGELIAKTLALLEHRGGINAFINIKYMCPAYESVRGR